MFIERSFRIYKSSFQNSRTRVQVRDEPKIFELRARALTS